MSDWQPIETAPVNQEVLVWVVRKGGGNIVSAKNSTGSQWWAIDTGAVIATHWQPLPAPPKQT